MKTGFPTLIIVLLCSTWGVLHAANMAVGPYFGQEPPGLTPTLFASGIVSLPNMSEIRVTFSPDGNECFFTRSSPNNAYPWHLYYTKCVNNVWTPPALAPFHPQQGDFTGQPFFSSDGNKLYFSSNANGTTQIWVVHRTAQGWGSPQLLPSPINVNNGNTVYYSETLDGTAYFPSNRPGGKGLLDIWRTRQVTGQSLEVENLGATINTSDYDYDVCVDPRGYYLLFARAGSVFLCYSDGKGGWRTPVNMNTLVPGFDTGGADGPSISPDGKYLFWRRYYGGPPDIYWVANPIPSPDPNGPVYNLSTSERFGTIQAAVTLAQPDQVLLLSPGTYQENVTVPNIPLTIRSANPQDSAVVALTTLTGGISLAAGTAVRSIQGLTITGGVDGIICPGANLNVSSCVITGHRDSGIEVSKESTLSLDHCIVAGNGGTGLCSLPVKGRRLIYSKVDLAHCTITQNRGYALDGDGITIGNSILCGNGISAGNVQIKSSNVTLSYSDAQGGFAGPGNMDADPLFVTPGTWTDPNTYIPGDWHLQSKAGHWHPTTCTWVLDDVTSPCIDAGDPNAAFGLEPAPNGSRVNLGAYGNTSEASKGEER